MLGLYIVLIGMASVTVDNVSEHFKKTVKKSGKNGSAGIIYLPKGLIDKEVIIIVPEYEEEIAEEEE